MSAITTEDLEGYLKHMESQAEKFDKLDYYIATDAIIGLLAYVVASKEHKETT